VWDNGWLILTTTSGEILALRGTDGHVIWRRTLDSPAHGPPALAADRVYVPVDDGRIVALHVETGELIWERRLGGAATALLALDDRIFAGSTDNFFYAIDAAGGEIAWRWRTGADVVGTAVVDDETVYFVSLDNVLRALSRGSGVQRWARQLPLRPTRGPLLVGRTLIVSGIAAMLHAYNATDGTPAAELTIAGPLAGAPYAVPDPPAGLPQLLVVTHDLLQGATSTLFVRRLEPAPGRFVPSDSMVVDPPAVD
jgi:outer membrane protein assembly factor BamB